MAVREKRRPPRPARAPPKRKLTAQLLWSQRGPLLNALVLIQVPFILTLWCSFQSKNQTRHGGFVWLDNYTKILTDSLSQTRCGTRSS